LQAALKYVVLACFLLIENSWAASAQATSGTADPQLTKKPQNIVHFQLYWDYLLVVKGSIAGLQKINFLIDTSANPSVFNRKILQVEQNTALEHSATFRKSAKEAWRATHNGSAPYEAGFCIDKDGCPGKIQLSIFATINARIHLRIACTATALGTLHVHNKYGEPNPSPTISIRRRRFTKWFTWSHAWGFIASMPTATFDISSQMKIGLTIVEPWAKLRLQVLAI
jgi:hypothetical protein